ncbi:MAG: CYTH domain-containing protein [Candidatus Saccharimonadales bacterium]
MKTEIEVKFLHVDHDDVRTKLEAIGGVCDQPMRLMRRVLIEPDFINKAGRDAFIRIRDEGHQVTVTFKEFKNESLTGAEEREIVVSDFDEAVAIFGEAGLHYRTFQESKRETWNVGDVEVVLDEWPWLETYIEVEGPSEARVREVSAELGFSWDDAVFGSVDRAYKLQYPELGGRGVIDVKEVRFDDPVPEHFGKSV